MKKIIRAFLITGCLLVTSIFHPGLLYAATISSIGVANYLEINANRVEDGDIITATTKGNSLSSIPYDSEVAGIVTTNPAIALKTNNQKSSYPVVKLGTVFVKVNGTNGSIKKGDAITTSAVPGTGMKATQSGYIVGIATQDMSFKNKSDTQLIPLDLSIHYLQVGSSDANPLQTLFTITRLASHEAPLRVLQYVVAAFITIASISFGFLIFAKVVNTGVEALGRNPLAGRMIQLSIIFNVLLIVFIILAGVSVSYLVIRL